MNGQLDSSELWSQDNQVGVIWNENNRTMGASASGLSSDEFLAAGEALNIDVDTWTISLADGGTALDLGAEAGLDFVDDNVVVSAVEVDDFDNRDPTTMFVVAEPDTFGRTLGELVEGDKAGNHEPSTATTRWFGPSPPTGEAQPRSPESRTASDSESTAAKISTPPSTLLPV